MWVGPSVQETGVDIRKGLQPCQLVIGARDGRFAGDPRCRSLRIRVFVVDSSPGPGRPDHRSGADRARGRSSCHRPGVRSAVPRDDRTAAAVLPAPARPVAVQPAAQATDASITFVQLVSPSSSRRAACGSSTAPCWVRELRRCASRSEFAGHAAYGYCASKSQWYWGMRLLLITDRAGAPVGYDLRPANENEREGVFQLASAHPGRSCSPTPHRGREHHDSLELIGVELIVPDKHKLGQRPPTESPSADPARDRIGVLDPQAPNADGDHLAKTLPRLAQRLAQRLLALTLGMLINALLGRHHAPADYDGR